MGEAIEPSPFASLVQEEEQVWGHTALGKEKGSLEEEKELIPRPAHRQQ